MARVLSAQRMVVNDALAPRRTTSASTFAPARRRSVPFDARA